MNLSEMQNSEDFMDGNVGFTRTSIKDPFALTACKTCKNNLLTKVSKTSGQCVHCRKDTLMQKMPPDRTLQKMEDYYKTNPPWGGKL